MLPKSKVTLSDISVSALKVAKQNKENLSLDVNIIESDLFSNIHEKYDVIITNPPYVMTTEPLPPTVLKEPHQALYSGEKGINHIEQILKNIKNYLNEKYIIAMEINEKSEIDITNLIKNTFQIMFNITLVKTYVKKQDTYS